MAALIAAVTELKTATGGQFGGFANQAVNTGTGLNVCIFEDLCG